MKTYSVIFWTAPNRDIGEIGPQVIEKKLDATSKTAAEKLARSYARQEQIRFMQLAEAV